MLQQYITEVLFKQQACSVPQVGTFTIQHIPAQFSVVDQTLTPPRQQVTFDTRWEDDGSCLHWISQKENLVESVATFKMDKYLQEFKAALQTGQPMELAGIGTLQLDPTGQVSFTPRELPDMWQPISVHPVLRPDAAPKVLQGNTEVVNQEVVEHLTVTFDDGRRFRWWWVVLPLMVIATGVSIWYLMDQWKDYSLANDNKPSREDTLAKTPPLTIPQDSSQHIAPPPPVNDSISYFVVFQTFNKKDNADKSLRNRHSWGFPEVVMLASDDSLKFSLAVPFTTLRADTTHSLDSIHTKFSAPVHIVY